jgi:hypothetical protein
MDMTKSVPGHMTLNLCFCIRWDLRVTLCIPLRPGHESSTSYFSCSSGIGTVSTKKRVRTSYAELMFLHSVGSTGHIVYSCASRAQNIERLFFMLRWSQYGFHKKRAGTRYAELLCLHVVGPVCHVVHFGASGYETSTHYFSCSSGAGTDLTKSTPRHVSSNLCFYIHKDLLATLCIVVHPGHKMSTHNVSCSGGTDMDMTKSVVGHITPTLCFCIQWNLWVT